MSSWIADSGCSIHLTQHKDWIHNYKAHKEPISIRQGNDKLIQAVESGRIETARGPILDVHYAPDISSNLFSLSSAVDKGFEIQIDRNKLILW